jgi:hypothetical protein
MDNRSFYARGERTKKELTEILLDSTNTLLKLQKMTNFSLCLLTARKPTIPWHAYRITSTSKWWYWCPLLAQADLHAKQLVFLK